MVMDHQGAASLHQDFPNAAHQFPTPHLDLEIGKMQNNIPAAVSMVQPIIKPKLMWLKQLG
jgi:hypothetical protein